MFKHLGTLLASIAGRLASVNPFRTPPPPPVLADYPRPVKWRKRPSGKHAMGHETPRKPYYGSHTMARLGLEGPHHGPGNADRRDLEEARISLGIGRWSPCNT